MSKAYANLLRSPSTRTVVRRNQRKSWDYLILDFYGALLKKQTGFKTASAARTAAAQYRKTI